MVLKSGDLTFLNVYERPWEFEGKSGVTCYVTVQDPTSNEVLTLKVDKGYDFPNRLQSGMKVNFQFNCRMYKNNAILTIIKTKVANDDMPY